MAEHLENAARSIRECAAGVNWGCNCCFVVVTFGSFWVCLML